jgi:hypothetical protein
VTVTAAIFSQLPAKWAQLQAAVATFGIMFWLFLLPLGIPKTSTTVQDHFIISRGVGWIAAGALCTIAFICILGPGFPT